MSEISPPRMPRAVPVVDPRAGTPVKIVYVLYLVGLFVPLTPLIGLVMAYVNRADAPAWAASHYRFQIRTFWIGLGLWILGAITSLIVIGWLILAAGLIWWIARAANGLRLVGRNAPIPDPTSWMLG